MLNVAIQITYWWELDSYTGENETAAVYNQVFVTSWAVVSFHFSG